MLAVLSTCIQDTGKCELPKPRRLINTVSDSFNTRLVRKRHYRHLRPEITEGTPQRVRQREGGLTGPGICFPTAAGEQSGVRTEL